MAKVKFKLNKERLASQTIKQITEIIESDELLDEVGLFSTDRLRFEARKGTPLNSDRSFPALKKLTIEQREYLEQYNKTHPVYSGSRSNVSFTGQLLNSLAFRKVDGGIELFFKGKRKGYRTGPKSRQKRPPTNAEVAEFLSDLGFKVFTKKGIEKDSKFQKNLVRIVRRFLRRALRRR